MLHWFSVESESRNPDKNQSFCLPFFLVDGVPATHLPITDRGLHYGDGVFTTMAFRHQRVEFLEQHLQRLQQSCERMALPKLCFQQLKAEVQLLTASCKTDAVVKIIITRGDGGRGYSANPAEKPRRILGLYPLGSDFAEYSNKGIKLYLCKTLLTQHCQPGFAQVKHLNKLVHVLARQEFAQQDFQEGVMLSPDGKVIEATSSNLFFVQRGELYTPELEHFGYAGLMREQIIQATKTLGIKLHQQTVTLAMLLQAEQLFLSNSLLPLWPVIQFQDKTYSIASELLTALKNTIKHELRQND